MNSKSANAFGTVLLRCRWRRVFSAMMAVTSIALTLAFSYVVFINPSTDVKESLVLKLLLGFFASLGLFVSIVSVRNLLRPLVLFEVTSRGIVVYMEGGVALAQPFFIPWERVESMEYVVQKGIDRGGDSAIVKTVGVKVRTDEVWSPSTHFKNNYDESKSVVHLDAFTGTPHGPELLRRIEEIRERQSRVTSQARPNNSMHPTATSVDSVREARP